MSQKPSRKQAWKTAEQEADLILSEEDQQAAAAVQKDINALKHEAVNTIPPAEPDPLLAVPQRKGLLRLSEQQYDLIFAEIEELLYLGGRHREDVMSYLRKHYGIKRTTAELWIRKVQERAREVQAQENLTDRHYQLERMAHALFNRAADGPSWNDIKRQVARIGKMIDDGKIIDARAMLAQMSRQKGGDLKTAQRILWNLCAMAGYGTKITVDVSGANAAQILGGDGSKNTP
jgi:hypothetical protein